MELAPLIPALQQICAEAGKAIMDVYRQADFSIAHKADDSPVTAADLAAQRVISAGLAALTPQLPQLSEEAAEIGWATRAAWQRYWCIDPLDGTKEFIRRNDEFTVNIALVEDGVPLLGMVHSPPSGVTYWGGRDIGAWKRRPGAVAEPIRCRPLGDTLVLLASRRHGQDMNAPLLAALKARFATIEQRQAGSSLKMCLIAEGQADFYPRLFPTSEWDTAAAQAIVEAAGGRLVDALSLRPLRYNRRAGLINPWFLVVGDPAFPLQALQLPPA